MKCWWPKREQTHLDFAEEEKGPGGDKTGGRQWSWRGKHRLDEKGEFVCAYRSHRTPRDVMKVAAARGEVWDMLPVKNRLGSLAFGTKPGLVCRNCYRLITTVVTYVEWIEHQAWRETNPSYGGYAAGYRPWYEPGAHPKSPGGPVGGQWKGRHTGAGEEFQCNYITRLRKVLRAKPEDGGCPRCGRMRNE